MKKRAITKFIVTSVLVVIGLFLSIFSFDIGIYTYNGFANSIKLGIDLEGGVLAVYNVKNIDDNSTNFDSQVQATIARISDLLTSKGYSEATVVKQGSGLNATQIRVEVPDVEDPEEILNLIGEPAELEIKKENSEEAEAIITGKHITNVQAGQQNGTYGVSIKFNEEGANLFRELTAELSSSNGTLYMFIGGEFYSQATVQETIAGGETFISGSMNSLEEAQEYATKIMSGTFDVKLTLHSNEYVSATLGKEALKWAIIGGVVGLALIFIIMYVVYKDFGLIANLSLTIYLILMLFFLQAIPLVQLTLAGIAGIILSLGMAVDANIVIFERMKEEYKKGKKIPTSVDAGFKKGLITILDSNVTTLIACLVLYIFGSGTIKSFAITLAIGILISMFTALVLTRIFCKWYLHLNSKNPKKLNFKREATVDEIK
ncbi:MAG: protein translocase subunit SecD [Clostridiales bacterium]|nr:protein translocase subunit SecD [Clostridiales bacterium]